MAAPLLFTTAAADTVAAGVFFAVAAYVHDAQAAAKPPSRTGGLFALGWTGLALYAAGAAGLDLGWLYAGSTIVAAGLHFGQVAALAIGLWGFACHLAFVLTGRRAFVTELALLYAAYYGVVAFALTAGGAEPVLRDATFASILVIPAFLSAVAFAALCAERVLLRHRLRAALLALGLAGWHASLVARGAAGASALGPVPTSAGLLAVACILISYGQAWNERAVSLVQEAAPRGPQASAEDPDASADAS